MVYMFKMVHDGEVVVSALDRHATLGEGVFFAFQVVQDQVFHAEEGDFAVVVGLLAVREGVVSLAVVVLLVDLEVQDQVFLAALVDFHQDLVYFYFVVFFMPRVLLGA